MAVFLEEVEEQLQIMEQEIMRLERDGSSEEAVQSLFRTAHTLKGSSAAMGFDQMKDLTHEMEHILDQVRNKQLSITNEMVNLLFKCLDHLGVLKDEIVTGRSQSPDIPALVEELHRFTSSAASLPIALPAGPQARTASEAVDFASLSYDHQLRIQEHIDHGLSIAAVTVEISPDCIMKLARAHIISNQLSSMGIVVHTLPPLESLDEDADISKILYIVATEDAGVNFEQALSGMMDIAGVEACPLLLSAASPSANPRPGENRQPEEAKRKAQTVRVDVERLEQLMNLVGELVIDQTQISRIGNVLGHRYASDDAVDDLEQVSDHISRVIGELQDSVMKARMLPIEQLFNRFPRMVRDLSQSLGKDIDLAIEGHETELDRTVIEEIGDPLIHLIRNAIDHGIESGDARRHAGKPSKGMLRITAAHEENQVVITVEDDGAGIDPDKMKSAAVRKGIITAEEAQGLSEKESIHLIFRPGFSTAATLSDVSGRGVGMDIVKSHIEKLNGIIDIDMTLGQGTRFKIKLPLTLAIITGLRVELNKRTFIIPMSSVVEIVRIPPEEIQTIKSDPVVVIRGEVLPLIWLHDYLQIPRTEAGRKHLPVVVVGAGEKRIAIVVDELNGNQEVVVKSLGSYVGKISGISGATILGDGRVGLIFEVAGIAKMMKAAHSG
ncbi:chemotaxis protein CheA [Cohnella luojiensis]|uniref:Chemotaxis protein CheA n=2 Tax=Cohnella luojiensis TaxID=652876 RepID=A0A4Y8LXH8_9BACL|nr:chemotaxis protein CheA [Cohnella luojiensis]